MGDLLDARAHYHVSLCNKENVIATAISRYRIHEQDWYATHPPDEPRPRGVPLVSSARTLANSVVRPWSWPCVMVFVRQWVSRDRLERQGIPRELYMPDGRVIPTCVVLATPDESMATEPTSPGMSSPMVGGGYAVLREAQGERATGTVSCLVQRQGTYFALTSRHVAGEEHQDVRARLRAVDRKVGRTSGFGVDRVPMEELFPAWPTGRTVLNIDAGLVRIDDVSDWTSQVYGVGEVGEAFDATEATVTLDLIGCPVRAYGAVSGVMLGEIQALFFRYCTVAGTEYATEVLIGPRGKGPRPITRPGDSGAIWFYDPPRDAPLESHGDFETMVRAPRGTKARRLRPIAMQWGGERIVDRTGSKSETHAYALGAFVSSALSQLGVEIVRDWSTGHDEYWGKLGHFAVGWKACDHVEGTLGTLLTNNQANLGYGDDTLAGDGFKQDRDDFVPLADVPDYVWVNSRPEEPMQHFADVDIVDADGGPSMLDRCRKDATQIAASVWKEYFDGFEAAGVGPEAGCLPFRVWQLWEAMVQALRDGDVLRFVGAGGVAAHYVGDASQPLHCSYMHHGRLPTITVSGRAYPIPKHMPPGSKTPNPAYEAYSKTHPAKIHSIYEETMLEGDTAAALSEIERKLKGFVADGAGITSGHDAAKAVIDLMGRSRDRLPPETIIDYDDPKLNVPKRAARLWANAAIRDATTTSLAESVKLQANLWQSAWDAAAPRNVDTSALGQDALVQLYRHDRDFVPSLSLDAMATSGDFEPTTKKASASRARQTSAPTKRRVRKPR